MYTKPTTLTEFILEEEKKFKHATGSFTFLLAQIENAGKIIASHIKKAGLVDILGETGARNVYSDEIKKIDQFSNNLLIDTLALSGQVATLGSEELEEPMVLDKKGHYNVFFDPLDGSSNIDVGITVGTIFSIYHSKGGLLQAGEKQVAAGYILYGTSVMFIYTHGDGVNGFTLDPSIGSFLLSHPDIKIPQKGKIYSVNEGLSLLWDESLTRYLHKLKKDGYKLRYVGSAVADVHRTLLKGGVFLYPADKKNPKGKLRLVFEGNALAFVVTQAGGKAVSIRQAQDKSGQTDTLSIVPKDIQARVPIAMGSPEDIDTYLTYAH